jgi:hypothetical protein
MKGSPFQRNFGVGSPAKQTQQEVQSENRKKVEESGKYGTFSKSYESGDYSNNEKGRQNDVNVQDAYDSRPPKKGDKGGHYYHMVRDPEQVKAGNVSLGDYKGPHIPQ